MHDLLPHPRDGLTPRRPPLRLQDGAAIQVRRSGQVEVRAFTEMDGELGPAELGGQIKVGDRVTRVDGRSTRGLDYRAVLDLIVGAPRPITIHFERKGAAGGDDQPAPREAHSEWVRPEGWVPP